MHFNKMLVFSLLVAKYFLLHRLCFFISFIIFMDLNVQLFYLGFFYFFDNFMVRNLWRLLICFYWMKLLGVAILFKSFFYFAYFVFLLLTLIIFLFQFDFKGTFQFIKLFLIMLLKLDFFCYLSSIVRYQWGVIFLFFENR